MEAKLNRDTNIAKAIGAWAGRHVEEAESGVFNQILVDKLKAIWDKEKTLKKDEYINLFGDLDDPILRDAVGLFTPEVRAMINNAFPDGEFWVRKDMVIDAVGYRAASVSDLWTGNSRWSPKVQKDFQRVAYGVFGKDAYKRLVTGERFIQNFVTDARVTIVVKSVIVPMANLAANFIQLMTRGVPIENIVRGMPKKAAEIKSFTEGRVKRIELEAELRAVTNDLVKTRRIQAEIQAIRDANRRMSIWPLIKAGEFASISDVGVDTDQILLAEGRLNAYIESLTSKLPPSVRTFGRYAVVAKDTSLYKGLQRAVEYGDFLGKAVLYDHLTKNKGLTSDEALAKITEEFVNYDRLPGRDRAYMENIGLMWFWNFKIRSAKIAASMIRNNPVHLLMTVAVPTAFGAELPGSPVTDNAISVLQDGRFEYSIGVDQAIHAHNLNPWMNALG